MKTLAVVSSRRNSGKTVTAINLAIGLNNNGRNTILLDADEQAKINFYLGHKERNTLNDVLNGKKDIIEALYLHPTGIRIVPSVINSYKTHTLHIKKPLGELKRMSDIIVVNAPVEYENLKKVLEASDEVLFVSAAEHYALRETKELIDKVDKEDKTILGMVLTKANNVDYSNAAAKFTGKPVLAIIPEDNTIRDSINKKVPLLFAGRKSKALKEYDKLTKLFI